MSKSDDDTRTAALMLAYGGMDPASIALALNVTEAQVIAWLRRGPDDTPPDFEPPQAA